jgi:hypothetical protein
MAGSMLVGGWYVGSNGNFVWEIMGWMDMLLKSVFFVQFRQSENGGIYHDISIFPRGGNDNND